MGMSLHVISFAVLLVFGNSSAMENYTITIRMDKVVPEKPDDLVCVGRKLDPQESYIVEFTPHAQATTAHHMMVYGCSVPAVEDYEQAWHCADSDGKSAHSVCGAGSRQIYFAWALDAPDKSLPEGVGLRVSGNTGIRYLIVQLHYAHTFEDGVTDNSGITLHMTDVRPPQQAGYIVIGTWGSIPPQVTAHYLESACDYSRNYTIYPIGYRTHSHNLGVVTSGYRIRNKEWTEIGRMSPQLPQTFYEVTNPGMDLKPGDMLAGRCTMNSMKRHEATYIGQTNHDEMCNFYVMYSTYYQGQLTTEYCFQDSDTFKWSNHFDEKDIPPNASSLEGIAKADEVRDKFNMKPRSLN